MERKKASLRAERKVEGSLQDLHEVPEHLWSARKRYCVPSGELKDEKEKREKSFK